MPEPGTRYAISPLSRVLFQVSFPAIYPLALPAPGDFLLSRERPWTAWPAACAPAPDRGLWMARDAQGHTLLQMASRDRRSGGRCLYSPLQEVLKELRGQSR